MKYSSNKEVNEWVRALVRTGATFWRGGKHGRLRLSSGEILTIPCTPSSRHAARNFGGNLKRALDKKRPP
jgi:hypothetical protein